MEAMPTEDGSALIAMMARRHKAEFDLAHFMERR